MNSELRARLESLADPGYRAFSARLLPVGTPLLGVRLPALRRIARELSRGDWRAYLDGAADGSFEETVKAVRQAKAMIAFNSMRAKAAANGYMSDEDIEAEIAAVRRGE